MKVPDLLEMWVFGVVNLFFSATGLFAAAAIVGIPLALAAAAFGMDREWVLWLLVYSAPLWAPVGAGCGLFTAGRLYKGMRRLDPSATKKNGPPHDIQHR